MINSKSSLGEAWMRVPDLEQKKFCEGRKKDLTSGSGSAKILRHCPGEGRRARLVPCKLNNERTKSTRRTRVLQETVERQGNEGSHQFYFEAEESFNKRDLCSWEAV